VQYRRGKYRPGCLGQEVARYAAPLEVSTQGEGDADYRIQVGSGDSAHKKNDCKHHQARGRDGRNPANRTPGNRVDQSPSCRSQHEKKGAEQFGEQSPPFEINVIKLTDRVPFRIRKLRVAPACPMRGRLFLCHLAPVSAADDADRACPGLVRTGEGLLMRPATPLHVVGRTPAPYPGWLTHGSLLGVA
jgi:hypothetical protein